MSDESSTLHSRTQDVDEETPLLTAGQDSVYDRFSKSKKKGIVAIVSFAGLVPLFVSGTFVPSIPQISKDLGTTGSVISLAVSLSVLGTALGALTWATYSGFYGRRPIYLTAIPTLALGSLGVTLARDLPTLFICRFIQAFGAGVGLSVGGGVIGDIYKLEERGTAMGIFFAACLLGPAIAPLAGGIAAHYYTWRHMQFILFIASTLLAIFMLVYLPETSQPRSRGIDKLLESESSLEGEDDVDRSSKQRRRRWVWLNPFQSVAMFRSPNLLAVCLGGTTALMTDYVLLVPLAYTIGAKYNISNEALIGAFFLPAGVGNIMGSSLAGYLSDRTVIRYRKLRGVWVPEDRLRTTVIGGLVLVPMSVLLSGVFTTWVGGTAGIVLNLLMLFVNGIGLDLVLGPAGAYFVDVMHEQSAQVMAGNAAIRNALNAIGISVLLPLIQKIGVLWTDVLTAILAWLGFL
ncbi:MFS general substrate transporter [Stereum hirsutum FP-91666 SS1]|uniref:MFS general substrate transporter n=1 Tax=Stereum hirsutum (strain FP-91666) TaxID=721885 RepID=UPI0004449971|nr:MFS general substrate transporter [Stereum hirsutum FP-91666 SS1]EIM82270.1 MFS general substrate transporter [Stereum hirsutum FP-91666 SS1]